MIEHIKNLLKNSTADFAEAHLEESQTLAINFRGNKLQSTNFHRDGGGNIRVLKHNGWAFYSFNDIDQLETLLPQAIATAEEVGKRICQPVRLAEVPVVSERVELQLQSDPEAFSLESKVQMIEGYGDFALSHSPLIKSVNVSYQEKKRRLTYINSEGTDIVQDKLEMLGAVIVTARKNGITEIQSRNWSNNNNFQAFCQREADIEELIDNAVLYLDAAPVKSGVYPVVCGPSQTGLFVHEAFGHLSEADRVYKNKELRDIMKIGRVFGSKVLNIYDTGLDVGVRGHVIFDDEGVRAEKTDLIREGILVGRLHSRQTAGVMQERPTGSARCIGYEYPPIVRMRNTAIAPGDASVEEMIASVELGVYAQKSKGGQTGGEMFTFTPGRTYMIRHGKIAEPVRNVSLTGNLFVTLKNIEMVASDYQIFSGSCGKGEQFPLPVSFAGPHMKINDVVVGGSK